MGATYLSMQLRTTDRDAVVAALERIASASGVEQFYVAEPTGGWLAVFPNFTPEIDRSPKALSAALDCLIVLLLSADEDDLYCMFFRSGKAPLVQGRRLSKATRKRAREARLQNRRARRRL